MTVITKKTSVKQFSEKLKTSSFKKKAMDMKKFSEKLSYGDGLKIQKQMRDDR